MTTSQIKPLPENLINQIAAGEVVQRPASVLKELVENAIDAGATEIKIFIEGAGSQRIEVRDNGKGMSAEDLSMCFVRHATSKLHAADDLFSIRTMGFRGEALASIASVAHVVVESRLQGKATGNRLQIEGGSISTQEECACAEGSAFTVNDLFSNIPARRNFLKSHGVEMKHLNTAFLRMALIHPDVSFDYVVDGRPLYAVKPSSMRKRICDLFGERINEGLIPVEESTEVVTIQGFIGKPSLAKKTNQEQFLFVNGRAIRSPYLQHAVKKAFEGLIAPERKASYFIALTVDANKLDINVHPAKEEVKFEEEKIIYSILLAALKHSLSKFQVQPAIDFDQEQGLNNYGAFGGEKEDFGHNKARAFTSHFPFSGGIARHGEGRLPKGASEWTNAFVNPGGSEQPQSQQANLNLGEGETIKQHSHQKIELFAKKYYAKSMRNGLMVLDVHGALTKIRFEQLEAITQNGKAPAAQGLLFSLPVDLPTTLVALMRSQQEVWESMGWGIRFVHDTQIELTAIPKELHQDDLRTYFDEVSSYLAENETLHSDRKPLHLMATAQATVQLKRGIFTEEMNEIIDTLFALKYPERGIRGQLILRFLQETDIQQMLLNSNPIPPPDAAR